jgi:hypothetical protein
MDLQIIGRTITMTDTLYKSMVGVMMDKRVIDSTVSQQIDQQINLLSVFNHAVCSQVSKSSTHEASAL